MAKKPVSKSAKVKAANAPIIAPSKKAVGKPSKASKPARRS